MESVQIFMSDAAMERCQQAPFLVGMVIHPSSQAPPTKVVAAWDIQYISPTEKTDYF
jgi:hypothetical protein